MTTETTYTKESLYLCRRDLMYIAGACMQDVLAGSSKSSDKKLVAQIGETMIKESPYDGFYAPVALQLLVRRKHQDMIYRPGGMRVDKHDGLVFEPTKYAVREIPVNASLSEAIDNILHNEPILAEREPDESLLENVHPETIHRRLLLGNNFFAGIEEYYTKNKNAQRIRLEHGPDPNEKASAGFMENIKSVFGLFSGKRKPGSERKLGL